MTFAHVQTPSGSGSGATTASATFSPAPTNGNFLIAFVMLGNTSGGFTAASGWTKIDGPNTQQAAFYKIAGAGESTSQSPCTWVTSRDWRCSIGEYSGADPYAPIAKYGWVLDTSTPQDLSAIDPPDSINTAMIGVATNDANRSYTSQTIGGVAANERADGSNGSSAALTVFDR